MKSCRYLIKYKDYKYTSGSIYKCVLANALLICNDLEQKWACGGCIIPQIMSNRPCKHIKPHKNFLIRGSSHTWFSCELYNIIMDLPAELCHTHCEGYEPINLPENNIKKRKV